MPVPKYKAVSHKELAEDYGINPMTLTRWIKRLEIEELKNNVRNRIYTPKQVQEIRNRLDAA